MWVQNYILGTNLGEKKLLDTYTIGTISKQ